jgi:hypothetical protein
MHKNSSTQLCLTREESFTPVCSAHIAHVRSFWFYTHHWLKKEEKMQKKYLLKRQYGGHDARRAYQHICIIRDIWSENIK